VLPHVFLLAGARRLPVAEAHLKARVRRLEPGPEVEEDVPEGVLLGHQAAPFAGVGFGALHGNAEDDSAPDNVHASPQGRLPAAEMPAVEETVSPRRQVALLFPFVPARLRPPAPCLCSASGFCGFFFVAGSPTASFVCGFSCIAGNSTASIVCGFGCIAGRFTASVFRVFRCGAGRFTASVFRVFRGFGFGAGRPTFATLTGFTGLSGHEIGLAAVRVENRDVGSAAGFFAGRPTFATLTGFTGLSGHETGSAVVGFATATPAVPPAVPPAVAPAVADTPESSAVARSLR